MCTFLILSFALLIFTGIDPKTWENIFKNIQE